MNKETRKSRQKADVEIHLGLGRTTRATCGVIVSSVFYSSYVRQITSDPDKVTCERCKKTNRMRWRKMVKLERAYPGIFDQPLLCGEKWLLDHGLDVTKEDIAALKIERIKE